MNSSSPPIATASLSGDCLITTVRQQRDVLLGALTGSGPIGVDVSGVTQADVSFVQLIASAALAASGRDRPFRLVGVPDAVAHAFRRSGIALDAATGHLSQT